MWNGVELPQITPQLLAATPHRSLVEHVLNSAADPTGAVIGLAPFDYQQNPAASESRGVRQLPKCESVTLPTALGNSVNKEEKLQAYRSYRVRVVMQMRIALRSGADGVSCLEVLLGALVTGDVRHHQVSIQESLSALLRCNEVLIMDGPLIMNCALAVIDGAFAPLTSGVRDTRL